MRLFHTTDAAKAILRAGFRDATGSYGLVGFVLTGVFLSDEPVDVNEGATGEQVLEVTLPDDLNLDAFELVEEGKGRFREWCVPAALINSRGQLRLLDQDEVDAEDGL